MHLREEAVRRPRFVSGMSDFGSSVAGVCRSVTLIAGAHL
jgi:hypothetical protein